MSALIARPVRSAPHAKVHDVLSVTWRCFQISFEIWREICFLIFNLQLYREGAARIALGKSLASLLERLGPTFIKLAQVLSSRPDVFSPALIEPLSRLREHVKPIPTRQIPALLAAGLGDPVSHIFRDFELSPIACGSVSQVHRAQLTDGQDVAVKIRRPGAAPTVRADLLFLRQLAGWLEHLPILRTLPLSSIIDECGRAIEDQLDFRMEAENMRRFRNNLAKVPGIIVPRVYVELSSDSVLIMEYVCNFNRVGEVRLPVDERRRAAQLCVNVLYTMTFENGLVHADLHPGNLFFTFSGDLVLVDFGMVTKLEGSDLRSFANFFFGMVTNRGHQCAQVIYDTSLSRSPQFDRARFEADISEMVSRHAFQRARDFEVSRFASELFQIQRRHGLYGSPKFVTVILAFVVLEGVVKQLYPQLDFMAQARMFIPRVIRGMRTWKTGEPVGINCPGSGFC